MESQSFVVNVPLGIIEHKAPGGPGGHFYETPWSHHRDVLQEFHEHGCFNHTTWVRPHARCVVPAPLYTGFGFGVETSPLNHR